jgi:hypothetical protein
MVFFVYRRLSFAKDSKWHLQERSSGDERSYSPVHLNEFFRLQTLGFAKSRPMAFAGTEFRS